MLEKKLWYAIRVGADDNDWDYWDYGFETMEEAEAKAQEIAQDHPEDLVRIAVIEEGNDPICIDEIIIQQGN